MKLDLISIINVKILLIIFLFILPGALKGQEVISIENGERFKPEQVDSFLHSLHNENDYVISFRLKFTDRVNEKSDSFVLIKMGNSLAAFNYSANSKKMVPLSLSDKSLQLVWNTFIQNDLFSMKNEADIAIFCAEKYHIYNSYTYEFVLLAKGEMKKLSYYDPEYYENACYGMVERKKIINSVAVITHVLSR